MGMHEHTDQAAARGPSRAAQEQPARESASDHAVRAVQRLWQARGAANILSPQEILALQRTIGNAAVVQLLAHDGAAADGDGARDRGVHAGRAAPQVGTGPPAPPVLQRRYGGEATQGTRLWYLAPTEHRHRVTIEHDLGNDSLLVRDRRNRTFVARRDHLFAGQQPDRKDAVAVDNGAPATNRRQPLRAETVAILPRFDIAGLDPHQHRRFIEALDTLASLGTGGQLLTRIAAAPAPLGRVRVMHGVSRYESTYLTAGSPTLELLKARAAAFAQSDPVKAQLAAAKAPSLFALQRWAQSKPPLYGTYLDHVMALAGAEAERVKAEVMPRVERLGTLYLNFMSEGTKPVGGGREVIANPLHIALGHEMIHLLHDVDHELIRTWFLHYAFFPIGEQVTFEEAATVGFADPVEMEGAVVDQPAHPGGQGPPYIPTENQLRHESHPPLPLRNYY